MICTGKKSQGFGTFETLKSLESSLINCKLSLMYKKIKKYYYRCPVPQRSLSRLIFFDAVSMAAMTLFVGMMVATGMRTIFSTV